MEEICEKTEVAERYQQRKSNLMKEKKKGNDMRAKALEKVGEARQRYIVLMTVEELPKKKITK